MFLKLVALLSCLEFGLAIRCYDCTSVNNSMCLDPTIYDAETLARYLPTVHCEAGIVARTEDFFCRKIKQTILHKHYEPEVRVMRGCGWRRGQRACYKADNEDHLETVCQCFGDMCNAAAGRYSYSYLGGLLVIAGICLEMLL